MFKQNVSDCAKFWTDNDLENKGKQSLGRAFFNDVYV